MNFIFLLVEEKLGKTLVNLDSQIYFWPKFLERKNNLAFS